MRCSGVFASEETQENFLRRDFDMSDLRVCSDESPTAACRQGSDPRSAALAVLANLELDKLDKLQHEDHPSERWKGQTMFKIPVTSLVTMLDDVQVVVNAAAECFAGEETVLRLQQPCFVFSDIHGDLMRLL
jgi:hypothetical protein